MQREHISQLHQHIVRLNCLNGWVAASHARTGIFPAVFPMFVTHTRKQDTLKAMKALELLNASLYLLLHTMICPFSTAVPAFESGSEFRAKVKRQHKKEQCKFIWN